MFMKSYSRNQDDYMHSADVNENFIMVNSAGYQIRSEAFEQFQTRGVEDFYFIYIVSGCMEIFVKEKWNIIHSKQFYIYKPHEPIHYRTLDNVEVSYYNLHFSGHDSESILSDAGLADSVIMEYKEMNNLSVVFENIFDNLIYYDEQSDGIAASLFTTLIYQIGREIKAVRMNKAQLSKRLDRSLEFIRKHFNENITVDRLAYEEHMSVSNYYLIFKKLIGCTPIEYITKIRLNIAYELINTTETQIKKIAEESGYTDQMYFSRLFKVKFGIAPTELRKNK